MSWATWSLAHSRPQPTSSQGERAASEASQQHHTLLNRLRHPNCWTTIIDAVLKHGVLAQLAQDANGNTPIHIAAWSDATNEILEKLVEECEERKRGGGASCCMVANNKGEVPLHVSSKNGAKHNTNFLIRSAHEATKIADVLENIPIHSACLNFCNNRVVSLLLESNPDSVVERNMENKLPLQLAIENDEFGTDPSVLSNLVKQNANTVTSELLFLALDKKVSGKGMKILLESFTQNEAMYKLADLTTIVNEVSERNTASEP